MAASNQPGLGSPNTTARRQGIRESRRSKRVQLPHLRAMFVQSPLPPPYPPFRPTVQPGIQPSQQSPLSYPLPLTLTLTWSNQRNGIHGQENGERSRWTCEPCNAHPMSDDAAGSCPGSLSGLSIALFGTCQDLTENGINTKLQAIHPDRHRDRHYR